MNNPHVLESDIRSDLVDLLSQACIELFTDYEISITDNKDQLQDLNEAGVNLIALIGLSEASFRSSLTLCVNSKLIKSSFPNFEYKISEEERQDWLGELANQLAGRFKNKVVPYGRKLELGIPTVIQGVQLRIDMPKCSNVSKHQFISDQGEVIEINFSTLIDDSFVLTEPELETTEVEVNLAEGEMLFF